MATLTNKKQDIKRSFNPNKLLSLGNKSYDISGNVLLLPPSAQTSESLSIYVGENRLIFSWPKPEKVKYGMYYVPPLLLCTTMTSFGYCYFSTSSQLRAKKKLIKLNLMKEQKELPPLSAERRKDIYISDSEKEKRERERKLLLS